MSDFEVRVRIRRVEPAPKPFSGRLSGVRFEPPSDGVSFEGAQLEDVDFSGLRIDRYDASGSTFERCDFSRAVLKEASFSLLPRSVYRDCRFDRADLRQADPGVARFERCSFERARLDRWECTHNDFVDCRFSGRLRNIAFWAAPHRAPVTPRTPERFREAMARERPPNEFRGNDFRAADLESVEFLGGIDLDAQLLPDDPEYARLDIRPEMLDRVEAYVHRVAPDAVRDPFKHLEPLSILGWLRGRYRGQLEVFTKPSSSPTFAVYQELLARATNE